jgi:hypothetical protein
MCWQAIELALEANRRRDKLAPLCAASQRLSLASAMLLIPGCDDTIPLNYSGSGVNGVSYRGSTGSAAVATACGESAFLGSPPFLGTPT